MSSMSFMSGVMDFDFSKVFSKKIGVFMSSSFKDAVKIAGKSWTKNFRKNFKFGKKEIANVKDAVGAFSDMGSSVLNVVGVVLQLLDAMGVLQPIMQLFQGILSVMGGSIMEKMVPGFEKLAEVLFGPEMMTLWTKLGEEIGKFLSFIMKYVAELFSDATFLNVLKTFGKIIRNVFTVITMALGWFFDLLKTMDPQAIGTLFYALGVGLAFMVGLLTGGIAGPILGAVFAGIAAIALAPLLAMAEGGIVTQPTLAIIGESGPEAVIPLNEEGGISGMDSGNQDVLWATEDNGDKLDKLIRIISLREGIL